MAAYLIADNEVTDPALFAEFARDIASVVEAHGGKYLVRGGISRVVRGDWTPQRLVIIEFESVEKAEAHVNSSEYQELAQIRSKCSNSSVFIVDASLRSA